MLVAILLIILGLGALIVGAESLVRGASSLAKMFGIPPIVIGLTIVAFGTSAPELIVNMFAAYRGSADLAVGNVIGSNIANILLILGIAACIRPLRVKSNTVWKEIPFALLAVVLIYAMGNDALFDGMSFNAITRTDGFSLLAIFAIFLYYIYGISKKEKNNEDVKTYSQPVSFILVLVGLAFLFVGGKILVDNAVLLARLAGLSEALIGLTIVAIGTSLPELVTSVVAVIHKQDDIAVGNIVGSNIFNIFWILGLTSVFIQIPFNPATNFDVMVSMGVTTILFVFVFVGKKNNVDRWQGISFVAAYAVYLVFLGIRG
ncbi:calcium/sodium antiporter [Patescibacteria group bacterium]|nr:calcium/sodium antiporter [Patescibacteria group bacterium]MBU1613154.1 calcium/sodium antiporter [Patescibacteria group bacterium]